MNLLDVVAVAAELGVVVVAAMMVHGVEPGAGVVRGLAGRLGQVPTMDDELVDGHHAGPGVGVTPRT